MLSPVLDLSETRLKKPPPGSFVEVRDISAAARRGASVLNESTRRHARAVALGEVLGGVFAVAGEDDYAVRA